MSVVAPGFDVHEARRRSPLRQHLRRRISRAVEAATQQQQGPAPPATPRNEEDGDVLQPLRVHMVAIHGWHWRDSSNRSKSCDFGQLARAALRMEILADVRDVVEDVKRRRRDSGEEGSDFELDEDELLCQVVRVSHTPLSGCDDNDQTLLSRVQGCLEELEEPLGGASQTVLDIATDEDRERLGAGEFSGLQLLADADIVWFVAHSQGAAVSVLLLDRLLEVGILKPPLQGTNNNQEGTVRPQHISLLSMAGVHQGTWETASALAVNRPATQEFFQMARPSSPLFRNNYAPAMKRILEQGVVQVACAGFGDLVVTLQSATADAWDHPNILRALYVPHEFGEFAKAWPDLDSSTSNVDAKFSGKDFLLGLSILAIQLRNEGSTHRLARFARSSISASTEITERISTIIGRSREEYDKVGEEANASGSGWFGAVSTALTRAGIAAKRGVDEALSSGNLVKESHGSIHHTLDVYRLGAVMCLHALPVVDREVGEHFVADNVPLTMQECNAFASLLDRLESSGDGVLERAPTSLSVPVAVRVLQDIFFATSREGREYLESTVCRVLEGHNFGVSPRISARADQLVALLPGLTRQECLLLLKRYDDDMERALAVGQQRIAERKVLADSFQQLNPSDLPPQYPATAEYPSLHS
jgi:hypothetical protein